MSNVDYEVYDFSTAGSVSPALPKALAPWLNNFAELFVDRWKDFSASDIKITKGPTTASTYAEAQNKWKSPYLAMPITIETNSIKGVLIASRVELLRVLMTILADDTSEASDDRELTSVEESLCQLLFEQAATTLAEAWPPKIPLSITYEDVDRNPGRNRMFAPELEMLLISLDITIAAGKSTIQLILPKDQLEALLNMKAETEKPVTGPLNIPIENISNVAVTMTASLGESKIDMVDLASISVGDVIALDQTIQSAIVLSVNDQPIFQAWPGRVGNKQCLKVESFVS